MAYRHHHPTSSTPSTVTNKPCRGEGEANRLLLGRKGQRVRQVPESIATSERPDQEPAIGRDRGRVARDRWVTRGCCVCG